MKNTVENVIFLRYLRQQDLLSVVSSVESFFLYTYIYTFHNLSRLRIRTLSKFSFYLFIFNGFVLFICVQFDFFTSLFLSLSLYLSICRICFLYIFQLELHQLLSICIYIYTFLLTTTCHAMECGNYNFFTLLFYLDSKFTSTN